MDDIWDNCESQSFCHSYSPFLGSNCLCQIQSKGQTACRQDLSKDPCFMETITAALLEHLLSESSRSTRGTQTALKCKPDTFPEMLWMLFALQENPVETAAKENVLLLQPEMCFQNSKQGLSAISPFVFYKAKH